jgi:4-phosphopantoate---beta-alanine ligase
LNNSFLPANHPRFESIKIREELVEMMHAHVLAPAGLIAHGRGEAFDYLIGEESPACVDKAVQAAAAALITAEHPVLSVNGNVAVLCPEAYVELSRVSGADLEINLFYRSKERIEAIAEVMRKAGAERILGTEESRQEKIPEVGSERKRVDRDGIFKADVVFVPLEDGDRTEALVQMGKRVITVDLNPLSRTSRKASISIMDNVVRAVPAITEEVRKLLKKERKEILDLAESHDNELQFSRAVDFIIHRLSVLAGRSVH